MKQNNKVYILLTMFGLSISVGGGLLKPASKTGFDNYTCVNAGDVCSHHNSTDTDWSWESDEDQHWKECEECDWESYLYGDHVDDNEDGYCDICNYHACSHENCHLKNDEDEHWKYCDDCEEEFDYNLHEDWDHNGYCDICNYYVGLDEEEEEEPYDDCTHENGWRDNDETEHWWYCSDCWEEVNSEDHYDDDHDGKCDVCGYGQGSSCDHDNLDWKDYNVEEHVSYCEECEEIVDYEGHYDDDYDGYCDVCERHCRFFVTFNMNGHGTQINNKEVWEDDSVSAPNSPTATGFVFGGWFTDGECTEEWNFNNSVNNDLTLYAKWTPNPAFKPSVVKSIGGWIMDKGTKKQIIAFGFTVSSDVYNSLVNDSDFGIKAYQSSNNKTEYANGTIASLKANSGRFYMYVIVDSNDTALYYAEAFVKYDGEYIYSSVVYATGNLNGTQYTL